MRACVYVCAHVGVCIYIPKCYCTAEKNKMYEQWDSPSIENTIATYSQIDRVDKTSDEICRSNAETLRLSRFSNAVMQSCSKEWKMKMKYTIRNPAILHETDQMNKLLSNLNP